MPSPCSVRPSAIASSDTTLSLSSMIDWSRVIDEVVRHQAEGDPVERSRGRCPASGRASRAATDEHAPALGDVEHVLDEVPQGADLRPAELVDAPAGDAAVDGARDRLRHVADKDRLEARLGAGERQHRQQAGERREAVEEAVARPEQQRGTQHHRVGPRREQPGLPLGLGARIGRRGAASAPMAETWTMRASRCRRLGDQRAGPWPGWRRRSAGRPPAGCRRD